MSTMFLSGSIFAPGQLAAMIAVGVLIGLIIIANVVIFVIYRRRRDRKLCTSQLQQKRDSLLEKLKNITDDGSLDESAELPLRRAAKTVEDEEEPETEEDVDESDDDDDSDDVEERP